MQDQVSVVALAGGPLLRQNVAMPFAPPMPDYRPCDSHPLWLGMQRPRAVPRDLSARRTHAAVAALDSAGSAA
jgi:hypothetical protein